MNQRSVLITGCSSGIGLELANRFAALGWRVHAGVRDTQRCPDELRVADVLKLDLGDSASITAAVAGIEHLDCLVNNAGYALVGPLASFTNAQMQQQMQVNFLGPVSLTQLLLPALRAARGRIICMSSLAGEIGLPMNSMYCASKFALEGWAEALSHELAPHDVQIALVEPGGHRTRFAANLRFGERALAADGIEPTQLQAFRAMLARRLARPGNPATAVADAVLRLAEAKRMPLRTRVGGDVRALHWMKSLLPERIAQRLLTSAFRRELALPKTPDGNPR